MKLSYKYDLHKACKVLIQKELEKFNISYVNEGLFDVKLKKTLSNHQYAQLVRTLAEFGIQIIYTKKELLVQQIKNSIIEMIHLEDETVYLKTSVFLAEKFKFSYGYLSNLFSEIAMTTIENFIILQKIEYAKVLLMNEDFTLKEIAHKLNYKSVAHLSNQFKKKTGLTPSSFKRILMQRKVEVIED
jgi:AraC-like DNA-binding protein